jgi:hypothetical protein
MLTSASIKKAAIVHLAKQESQGGDTGDRHMEIFQRPSYTKHSLRAPMSLCRRCPDPQLPSNSAQGRQDIPSRYS